MNRLSALDLSVKMEQILGETGIMRINHSSRSTINTNIVNLCLCQGNVYLLYILPCVYPF